MLYFGGWQPWGGGGPTAVQMLIPFAHPPPENQGARAFTERGRGLHAEIAQSAQTVSLKLVIGNLTSVFLIVLIDLIFSARVNLFQFLEASSAVVASYVMTAVWFSCS